MATGAKKDAVVAAEAKLVHGPLARTSLESSSEERYKGRKLCPPCKPTCSRPHLNRNHKSYKSDSPVLMHETDSAERPVANVAGSNEIFPNLISIVQFK